MVRLIARVITAFAALAGTGAAAEVKLAAADRFEVEDRIVVPVPPATAFAALTRVQTWWDPAHTYSGVSANLSLAAKAGGCFCEAIPQENGSVEHGRVLQVRPGVTLRLDTALGPLQSEPVVGVLTWSLKAVPAGTEITQHYIVGGPMKGDGATYAPVVDQVLSIQLRRLAATLSR